MLALKRYSNNFPSVFEDIFGDMIRFDTIGCDCVNAPLHDIIEADEEFVVETALAGIKKEDISLNVDDGILTIKAERKERDDNYNRKQTFFGKYEKSFTLPENVNVEKIDASFTDGILQVKLPKQEDDPKKSKVIEVQ